MFQRLAPEELSKNRPVEVVAAIRIWDESHQAAEEAWQSHHERVEEAARAIAQERAPPDSWLSALDCEAFRGCSSKKSQGSFQSLHGKVCHSESRMCHSPKAWPSCASLQNSTWTGLCA